MKYEDKDDTDYTFTYVFGACPLPHIVAEWYGLLFAVGKQLEDMIHMIESDLYETGWE